MKKNKVILGSRPNIITILYGELVSRMSGKAGCGQRPLPESIDGYQFLSLVRKTFQTPNPYQLALYENEEGARAFVKQWSGHRKNLQYYWLLNEVALYEALSLAYSASRQSLSERFPGFRIPRLLKASVEENRLLLMIEYIPGKDISSSTVEECADSISVAIQFFSDLGQYIDSDALVQRGPLYMILNFFRMLPLALVKHAKEARTIFACAWIFCTHIPFLVRFWDARLIHRDLTEDNIIANNNDRAVLDFELSVVSHPLLDSVQSIAGTWHREGFWEAFYRTPYMKNVLRNERNSRLYWLLSIYAAITALAERSYVDSALTRSYLHHSYAGIRGEILVGMENGI